VQKLVAPNIDPIVKPISFENSILLLSLCYIYDVIIDVKRSYAPFANVIKVTAAKVYDSFNHLLLFK